MMVYFFQFESLMQLISLVCSSMKDVFKATIAEMRSTNHSTNPANPVDPVNPRIDASDPKPDPDQTFESFYDEIHDDRRKCSETLREVGTKFLEIEGFGRDGGLLVGCALVCGIRVEIMTSVIEGLGLTFWI